METYIYNIIVKSFKNEIETSEKQELDDWLKLPENSLIFDELEKVWQLTGNLEFSVNPDIKNEWARFNKLVQNNSEIAYLSDYEDNTKSIKPYFQWSIGIAASIIFICLISYVSFWNGPESSKMVTAIAGTEKQTIALPDGSLVTINNHSQITYPEDFTKNRKIKLKGEAFFEVTKGKGKFTVSTPLSETVVLGTVFNLKADTVNNQVLLIVVEGKVKFKDKESKTSEIVENGQQAILDAQNHKINKNNNLDQNLMAWKTGKLSFNNTKLSEIILITENYFNKKLIVDQNIDDMHYTGSFESPSIGDFFDILSVSLGVKYTQRNDTIFLQK